MCFFFLLILIIVIVVIIKKQGNAGNSTINSSSVTVQPPVDKKTTDSEVTRFFIEDYNHITKTEKGSLDLVADLTREQINRTDPLSYMYSVYKTWEELMDEPDSHWSIQVDPMIYAEYGRLRFAEMKNNAPSDMINVIAEYDRMAENIKNYVRQNISRISKECDMSIIYPYMNNGRMERAEVQFDCWRLEHFENFYRYTDINSGYYSVTAWDYCLGKDGRLYLITSDYGKHDNNRNAKELRYSVRELLPFNILFMGNRSENVFVSVMHGLLSTLDMIPMDEIHVAMWEDGKEKYTYNFPLQTSSAYYSMGEGIIARINRLMGSGATSYAMMEDPLNSRKDNGSQENKKNDDTLDMERKLRYLTEFSGKYAKTDLGEIEERKFISIYKELADSGRLDTDVILSFMQVCLNNLDYVFKGRGIVDADDFISAVEYIVYKSDFENKEGFIKLLLESRMTEGEIFEWSMMQTSSGEKVELKDRNWVKIRNYVKELAIQFHVEDTK